MFRWSEEFLAFDEDDAIEYKQDNGMNENAQSHSHSEYIDGEYMMEPDHYLEDRDADNTGLQNEEMEYNQNYPGYQQPQHAYY